MLHVEPLEQRRLLATVNIAVSETEIQENPANGTNAVTIQAIADAPVVGDQTVDVVTSGTDITAGDFTLDNVTITIPDGQTTGMVTFTAVNDLDLEIRETATLTLTNLSAGLQPGATMSLDVDIRDSLVPDLQAADMQAVRDALSPVITWVGDEPCTWQGIGCSDNNIVSITVVGQRDELVSLPPLPNLTELISLQVRKIDLTGSLPTVEHLTKLRVVRLDENQLSGPLSNLGNNLISSLVFFNATSNALTGPIPAHFFGNPDLQLELVNNSLSGTFPTENPGGNRSNFNGNMIGGVLPDWVFPSSTFGVHYNMLDVANTPIIPGRDEGWRHTQTVPPTNVQVSSPSAGTAELTWTPILYQGNGGHYEVLSSTTPNGPYISRGTTAASGGKTATGLTVTGLPGGTNYFVVRTFTPNHAFNPNDLTSNPSEEVTANAGPMTVGLTAPDAVATESGDAGTFRLTRDNPNDALTVNLTRNAASTADDAEFELSVNGNPPINIGGGTFSVTFPDGDDTLDITLTALADSNDAAEAAETITLDLSPGDYLIDAAADTGTVTIVQNGFLVTTTSDAGTGSLRQAVQNAQTIAGADVITFSDGTGGTVNFFDGISDTITFESVLYLSSSIRVDGPGQEELTIRRDPANPASFGLISVELGGVVELHGLTLTGGKSLDGGGAISNRDGVLTITSSTLVNNSAANQGGAIHNPFGTLTIQDSTLSNNTAPVGGAIYVNHDEATILNSTLSHNSTGASGFGLGGAIYNRSGTLTIQDSTLSNNTARIEGGAVTSFGTATIHNSALSHNSASLVGGGISSAGTLIVSNSTLWNNSTEHFGGGMSNSGIATVIQSTLSGNSASAGGAIGNQEELQVIQSTITGNTADGTGFFGGIILGGGGIAVIGNASTTEVLNSVIAGNTTAGVNEDLAQLVNPAHVFNSNGFNFFGDPGNITVEPTDKTFASTNTTITDILDITLANNGGSTLTHALLPQSPAIDMGNNIDAVDSLGNPLTTDQRGPGFDRLVGAVDIGALELQNQAPIADAGGPYMIDEGDDLILDASASTDPDLDALTFRWDIDGDGDFDEGITGQTPTVTWTQLVALGIDDGPDGPRTVTVEVSDGIATNQSSSTLTVNNVAPLLNVDTDASSLAEKSTDRTVVLSGQVFDAGTSDTHTVVVDWGDGSALETISAGEMSPTLNATHTYPSGGIFSITVSATDDDGGQVSAETSAVVQGIGLVDGTVYVIGTDGRDVVKVKQRGATLHVWSKLYRNRRERNSFAVADVNSIHLIGCAGNDHLHVRPSVKLPATIDGGDGRDWLVGGRGDNTILGGAGNDKIRSLDGNDLIDAGDGNDRVFAGRGNDIVLGGAGHDRIFGTRGNNILIGGAGSDWIIGGLGDDLIIGGTTSYDNNFDALNDILSEWASGNSYWDRIDHIRNGTGATNGNALASGSTVFDDNHVDVLIGWWGRDWYFANSNVDRFRTWCSEQVDEVL